MLCNDPGNRKTLLLSTGHVTASLRNRTIIAFRLCIDKLGCLRCLRRFFHRFVADFIFSCELDIGSDRPGKEHALLGNHSHHLP